MLVCWFLGAGVGRAMAARTGPERGGRALCSRAFTAHYFTTAARDTGRLHGRLLMEGEDCVGLSHDLTGIANGVWHSALLRPLPLPPAGRQTTVHTATLKIRTKEGRGQHLLFGCSGFMGIKDAGASNQLTALALMCLASSESKMSKRYCTVAALTNGQEIMFRLPFPPRRRPVCHHRFCA